MNELTLITATASPVETDLLSDDIANETAGMFKDILDEVTSSIELEESPKMPELMQYAPVLLQEENKKPELDMSKEDSIDPLLNLPEPTKKIEKPKTDAVIDTTLITSMPIFQPVQTALPSENNKLNETLKQDISQVNSTDHSVLAWLEKSLQQEIVHQKSLTDLPIKSEPVQLSYIAGNLTAANENKLPNQVELTMTPLKEAILPLVSHQVVSQNVIKEFNFKQESASFDEKESQALPIIEQNNLSQAMTQQTPIIQHSTVDKHIQQAINSPVVDKNWPTEFSEKLKFFANNDISQATLLLNPKDLGTVEAQIKIVDNKAEITLVSQHANVRDAIEQSLPQLKQLFDSQEVSLSKVFIAESSMNLQQQGQSFLNQGAFSENSSQHQPKNEQERQEKPLTEMPRPTLTKRGEIDYYA